MSKKKLNTNSNSIHKILPCSTLPNGLVIGLALVFLLSFCCSSMANSEDYVAYAKKQAQKAKEIIVPYKTEVDEIIKNISVRQLQPDIQIFKKEITTLAQNQCPMQHQDVNHVVAPLTTTVSTSTPILIFVSFSMPKESIKSWIAQAKKVGAAVYIRGLVNNSFKDTTKAVHELVQDQPGGLLIDPTLFKKYAIAQVPAVIVTSGDSFDAIYGDVTLDYALEKISKVAQGGEQKYLLDTIKKLRGKKQVN